MNDPDFALLRSTQAIPCRRQVNGESGGATVHCVVLADGLIVDCGSDGYAEDRAKNLADAVNAYGPGRFAFGRARQTAAQPAKQAEARSSEQSGVRHD